MFASSIFVKYKFSITLCNPGIFRTLAYSEPEEYSEPDVAFSSETCVTLVYSKP